MRIAAVGDPPLDYYLIFAEPHGRRRGEAPTALLVEEFRLRPDHTAAGIVGAAWTPPDGEWRGRPDLSRGIRAGADLRDRAFPVGREASPASCRCRPPFRCG